MALQPKPTPERFYAEMLAFANNNADFRQGQVHGFGFTARETFDFENACAASGVEDFDEGTLDTYHEFGAHRKAELGRLGAIAFFGNTTVVLQDIECPPHIAEHILGHAEDPPEEIGPVTMTQRFGFTIVPDEDTYIMSMNSSLVIKNEFELLLLYADDDPAGEDEAGRNPRYSYATYYGEDADGEVLEEHSSVQYMPDFIRPRLDCEPVIEDTLEAQAAFWRQTIDMWQEQGEMDMQQHLVDSNLNLALATFRGLRGALQRQLGIMDTLQNSKPTSPSDAARQSSRINHLFRHAVLKPWFLR